MINDLEARDRGGRTALANAVIDRRRDDVARLLSAGADSGTREMRGWTPMHFAAQNDDTWAISALAEYGAPVNAVDDAGNTVLHRAVFNCRGDGSAVELLLHLGADPDIANSSGVSSRVLAHRIATSDVRRYFP